MTGHELLLSPPVAFIAMFVASLLLLWILSALSFRRKTQPAGMRKAYACGETMCTHFIQPDYGQFFPFAFFFTVLHVVVLMLATVPAALPGTLLMATVYVLAAIIGLSILLRR